MRMIVLLGAFVAAGAQAQVYKCVDPASGRTVYSQSPCPAGARGSTLKLPATPPATAPSADGTAKAPGPRSIAELEQEFRKRRIAEEEARRKQEQQAAEARVREQNCRAARQNLAMLEAGGRQVRFNEKGERFFLDDAQIEEEKVRARAAVAEACR